MDSSPEVITSSRRETLRPRRNATRPETSGQVQETPRPRRMASRPLPETPESVPGTPRPRRVATRPPPRRVASQMCQLQLDEPVSKRTRRGNAPVPALVSDSPILPPTPPESSPEAGSKRLIVRRNIGSDESIDGYHDGGYCKIRKGEVLNARYKIIDKLGSGGYSTVWKAEDKLTKRNVALKIAKSHEYWSDNVKHEIEIMDLIERRRADNESSKYVTRLLDSFTHTARNGYEHIVMVLELVGENLDTILRNNRGIHIDNIRKICRQVLEGLQFLHDTCGIIHCDLKPDNIMLQMNSEDETKKPAGRGKSSTKLGGTTKSYDIDFEDPNAEFIFKIGDFGLARTGRQGEKRVMPSCNYCCPEEYLHGNYGFPVDMWSYACTVFEMVTSDILLGCNESIRSPGRVHHLHHVTQTYERLGEIRVDDFRTADNEERLSMFFREDGTFKFKAPYTEEYVREFVREPEMLRHKATECNMSDQDAALFQDFMLGFLKINPTERRTAQDGLDHQFLQLSGPGQGYLVEPSPSLPEVARE